MLASFRRYARKSLDKVFEAFGFEVVRKGWDTARLRKDFRIQTLIDVGVGVGGGTPKLYSAFSEANLLLVEPNPTSWPYMDQILQERKGLSAKLAAGPVAGQMKFYSYPTAPELSSFVACDGLQHLACNEIEVAMQTLDQIVQSHASNGPFGLKIDTEGFELEVLRGSTETLQNTEFVLLESQIDVYGNRTYTQAELYGFLDAHGFQLYDIIFVAFDFRLQRVKQADLLFRRLS